MFAKIPAAIADYWQIDTGGSVCEQNTAVPHMGYFTIYEDTEHNTFALWEMNERAA